MSNYILNEIPEAQAPCYERSCPNCGYNGEYIFASREQGQLYCSACGSYYPIVDVIRQQASLNGSLDGISELIDSSASGIATVLRSLNTRLRDISDDAEKMSDATGDALDNSFLLLDDTRELKELSQRLLSSSITEDMLSAILSSSLEEQRSIIELAGQQTIKRLNDGVALIKESGQGIIELTELVLDGQRSFDALRDGLKRLDATATKIDDTTQRTEKKLDKGITDIKDDHQEILIDITKNSKKLDKIERLIRERLPIQLVERRKRFACLICGNEIKHKGDDMAYCEACESSFFPFDRYVTRELAGSHGVAEAFDYNEKRRTEFLSQCEVLTLERTTSDSYTLSTPKRRARTYIVSTDNGDITSLRLVKIRLNKPPYFDGARFIFETPVKLKECEMTRMLDEDESLFSLYNCKIEK